MTSPAITPETSTTVRSAEVALARSGKAPIGSLAWLRRTGGSMSFRDRMALMFGFFGALREGLRLGRRAKNSDLRDEPLATFAPPPTPMVIAARDYLTAHSHPSMVNHCHRTAFWTLAVLHQHGELTELDRETAWVAALLHDVGLDVPPAKGDFSLGGIQVLEQLAHDHAWSDEQTYHASEAIASNLAMRVDPRRVGKIAWAMNVGGIGEVGFGPHRKQMHPDRIDELEAQYPRLDLGATSMRLIKDENRRMPRGRFTFFRYVFPMIMQRDR